MAIESVSLFLLFLSGSPLPSHILVVASETPDQQNDRRRRSGQASHETYIDTLLRLDAGCTVESVSCVTEEVYAGETPLEHFDGIVFAGSPIQMHEDTPETRSAARFMVSVYASGTPSFGSCAGLQIAAVAAGGTTKLRDGGMKAAISRRIVPTEAGWTHPLLKGRPATWDAPAMHASLVERLPSGATILAYGEGTPIEAAEIRSGNSVFWGVQYHPEITLGEVADALQSQSEELVKEGLAQSDQDVRSHAASLNALHENPDRIDLAWQLGLDRQVTDFDARTIEIANFLNRISRP